MNKSILLILVLGIVAFTLADNKPKPPGLKKPPAPPPAPAAKKPPAAAPKPEAPKPQAPPPDGGPEDGSDVPYDQRPNLEELARRPDPGVEIGCSYDVFFGDERYLLRGLDYCANIKCGYNGPRIGVGNVASCTSVTKMEMIHPHDIHHNKNTIYTVKCQCPQIGHNALATCSYQIPISYKLVPRVSYADCVLDYGNCGGGKYCFLSAEKMECPANCYMFTNYRGGMITLNIQYACCKNI